MSYWKPFFLALSALFIVSCESTPELAPHADWADVTLHAVGVGPIQGEWSISERIQAVQRAKVDAYVKLESQVMMLQTDSKKTVSELAGKDPQLGKKISSFVKGAKIIRTDNKENGIEVLTELFLGENFKATLGLAEKKVKPIPKSNNPRDETLPSSRY
ncbi:MAG: hypothetical protein HY282_03810 [Nitrospirae bacterium]|nr:hypothetical protein [Candidatus Manganitrophaceae bacterium]